MNKKRLLYDARGNGEGNISPTITGDHQDRITDYTAIVVEYEDICGEEVFQMGRGRCLSDIEE